MTPAPVNGYCTLAQLRSVPALNFEAAYTTDDQLLCDIITATSRNIDKQCARYFYKSSSAETHYFTAQDIRRVYIGDTVSVSAVVTDTATGDRSYPYTWASTDYDLWPYDAAQVSEAEPYRFIETTPAGLNLFPYKVPKGVKITGIFGWPAVPQAIMAACLIWSERTYKRLQTPLGSASMTPFGQVAVRVPPPDPDVEMMLNNYRLVAA